MPTYGSTLTDSPFLAGFVAGREPEFRYGAEGLFPVRLPLLDPQQRLGSYNVVDPQNERARIVDATWEPGSVPNVVFQSWGSGTYEIKPYRLKDDLTDEELRVSRDGIDVRQSAAVAIEQGLRLKHEQASLVLARATVAADTASFQQAAVDTWKDKTNGDPRTDFQNMHKLYRDSNRGRMANCAIIPQEQFISLLTHPSLTALISGGATIANPAVMINNDQGMAFLKAALGVEYLFVPNVNYNSANLGQDESNSVMWGDDDVYLTWYGKPMPRQAFPGLGTTFVGQPIDLYQATANDAGIYFMEKPFDKETGVQTVIGGLDFDVEVTNSNGVVKLTGSNAAA